ncbi:MAG: hypothetical protein R3B06_27160 [Kofleriaceae bacterium]
MKYAWIIVILALAGGGWWWRGHDRGARSRAAQGDQLPAGAAGGAAVGAPSPASAPAEVRALRPLGGGNPVPAPAPPEPSGLAASPPFDREARDPAWADDQERELRLRLAELDRRLQARGATVDITGAQCRATACQVELAAPASRDLSAFYGAIETPEGLSGWADGVVLGEVVTDPTTGAVTTQVTVVFDRSP